MISVYCHVIICYFCLFSFFPFFLLIFYVFFFTLLYTFLYVSYSVLFMRPFKLRFSLPHFIASPTYSSILIFFFPFFPHFPPFFLVFFHFFPSLFSGGIMRCDVIAAGILQALNNLSKRFLLYRNVAMSHMFLIIQLKSTNS